MKEMESKSKRKTKFKFNCRDAISVFAVLMITGVLLAISAYAQPDHAGTFRTGRFFLAR